MILRAPLAGLLLGLFVATAAAADDVVGRWVLDEAAFREQAQGFFESAMQQVPAEQQAQAEAYAQTAIDTVVAQMVDSSVTFAGDGSVVMQAADDGPQEGSWTREGDVVRLEPAVESPDTVGFTAELQADGTLLLRADVPGSIPFVMRRVDD